MLEEAEIASRVPASVCEVIERGRRGEIEETLKSDDPAAAGAVSVVIGSNRLAVTGAAAAAKRLGYEVRMTDQSLAGETSDCARRWIAEVLAEVSRSPGHPVCMIAGGETTVNVHGAGKGGRNQEFALGWLRRARHDGVVLSGALTASTTPQRGRHAFAAHEPRLGKALCLTDDLWVRNTPTVLLVPLTLPMRSDVVPMSWTSRRPQSGVNATVAFSPLAPVVIGLRATRLYSPRFRSFQGEGLHAGRRHLFHPLRRMQPCSALLRYPESLERFSFRVYRRGWNRHQAPTLSPSTS